jgi:hypothetical protein
VVGNSYVLQGNALRLEQSDGLITPRNQRFIGYYVSQSLYLPPPHITTSFGEEKISALDSSLFQIINSNQRAFSYSRFV